MPRVLFTPNLVRDAAQPYFRALEAAGFEVVFPPPGATTFDRATLVGLLSQADAMLASTEPITDEVLAQCPKLRVLARWGVGYDSIDVAAATRRNMVVTISPGVLEECVAEHTLALMLSVARDVLGRDREVRSGTWVRGVMPRLAGRTLGIVGLGRIGRAVAAKAQAIGMRVMAHDPHANASTAAAQQIELIPLPELIERCDVISLHCVCNRETMNLLNSKTLAQLKRGAIVINTGRGGLVDEEALCESLNSGHLLGAALDVFAHEPLPLTSPLFTARNLILAPHMGGLDDQTVIDAPRLAADCIIKLHRGEWPAGCVVNEELRPGWKW